VVPAAFNVDAVLSPHPSMMQTPCHRAGRRGRTTWSDDVVPGTKSS
jgi:hypothetical protein